MALYTKLTKKQISKLIAPFGLPPPKKIRGVLEGTVNTYYELTFPQKAYFLRIDEVADLGRLKNELRVFKVLEKIQRRLSFQTTLPLKTIKGKPYIPFGRKFVLLFEKIKGASYFHRRLKGKHLRQIGQALAELHLYSQRVGALNLSAVALAKEDLTPLQPHRFHFPELLRVHLQIKTKLKKKHPTVNLEIQQWMAWLKANDPVGALLAAPLLAAPSSFGARRARAQQAAPLPIGLIHADLFPENLLFIKDRLQGILDYEAAGRGPFLFDIAVTFHACCHDGKAFSYSKCRSLLRGYQKVRKLNLKEKKGLDYYLYQSAMRFLLTRLRDFELKKGVVKAKPFKDYEEYLRRFSEIPSLIKRLGLNH